MKLLQGIKRRLTRHKTLLALYADKNTIFIYQMGKVGSTTLEQCVPNAVHIHAFHSKNHTCPVRLKGLAKFGLKHFFYRLEQELLNYLLRRTFKRRKHTKIITLVRDPIARNISMFFHDLDAYLFAAHTNCLNTRKRPLPTREQSMATLKEVFEQEFDHCYSLTWFDKEFLPMTGINIYQQPFDIENGVGYSQNNNIELLCLRSDKLRDNLHELQRFVGAEVILSSTNQAKDKWYGDIYQKFKLDYTPSAKLQNEIEKSQFYKKFFDL